MHNLSLIVRAVKHYYRFDRVEVSRGTVYGTINGAGVAVGRVSSFTVADTDKGVSVYDGDGRLLDAFKGADNGSRQKAL